MIPAGFRITRGAGLFKPITVETPLKEVAFIHNTARNPENVLYKLAEALLDQPAPITAEVFEAFRAELVQRIDAYIETEVEEEEQDVQMTAYRNWRDFLHAFQAQHFTRQP